MSLLTDQYTLPSVQELKAARPELQSDHMDEFFEKLNLPKQKPNSDVRILVKGHGYTYKTDENVIRHPFAYFNDINGNAVIIAAALVNDCWQLLTTSVKTNITYGGGVLTQANIYKNAPDYVEFLKFADLKVVSYDYRSVETEKREGGEEFHIQTKRDTIRFHGRKISETDSEAEYEVFIGTISCPLKLNKVKSSFDLGAPIL